MLDYERNKALIVPAPAKDPNTYLLLSAYGRANFGHSTWVHMRHTERRRSEGRRLKKDKPLCSAASSEGIRSNEKNNNNDFNLIITTSGRRRVN